MTKEVSTVVDVKKASAKGLTHWEERLLGEGRYRVDISEFSGPLDLLMHLIRINEVEISDIPVADITAQFLLYLKDLEQLDLDDAGDFLLMAATLMEIKSKMLLPDDDFDDDDDQETDVQDPRWELVQQLMAYRIVKEASMQLETKMLDREGTLPPGKAAARARPQGDQHRLAEVPIDEVEVWDLVRAFARVLRETSGPETVHIAYNEIPVAMHMEQLMTRLEENPGEAMSFYSLAREHADRTRLIGFFLALLELIRMRKIYARQESMTGDIELVLRPKEEQSGLDGDDGYGEAMPGLDA